MINTIECLSPRSNFTIFESIPAICCGNVCLYPTFDGDGFTYSIRHILTGRYFGQAGCREVALKSLRELSALHSWNFNDSNLTYKLVEEETLVKVRSIVMKMSNSFDDDEVHPIHIIRKTVERRMRRGKFVPEKLRAILLSSTWKQY